MADNITVAPRTSPQPAITPAQTSQTTATPQPQTPAHGTTRSTDHMGGLGACMRGTGAALSTASSAIGRVSVSAYRATVNSSVVAGSGHALKGAAETFLPLHQLGNLGHAAKLRFAAKGDSAKLRNDLQATLTTLKTDGSAASQAAAHAALVEYGTHAGQLRDFFLPLLHKTALIGVSGTSMAFGAGRNTGVAAGDTAVRESNGAPFHDIDGVHAPAVTDDVANLKSAAAQWVLGSVAGGVGNITGEHFVKPLVNLVNRQHLPVSPNALVPDEMVQLMNQLEAGSGDRLRAEVSHQQSDKGAINSDTNKLLGKLCFDSATIGKAHMQGTGALGFAGTVGVGLAVSASAGGLIGAGMALNAALSTIKVPDLAQLRAAVQANAAAAPGTAPQTLANVTNNDLPLFYPHRPPPKAVGTAMREALHDSPLRDPQPNVDLGPLPASTTQRSTAAVVTSTAVNTLSSVANRSFEMLKATPGLFLSTFATPIVARAMPTPELQATVRDVGAGLGIHSAIEPWFDSLAKDIPQTDKAMQARRQEAVNEDAQRRINNAAIAMQAV